MNEQVVEILEKHSELLYLHEKESLSGRIYIDEDDYYSVLIDFSDFPTFFPKVFEVGERIPQKADRHINSDLSCCFTTPAKECIYLKSEVKTLYDFIEKILIPYLQNNSFYELNGCYKCGEYSHHPEMATYETYKEILGIKSLNLMCQLLYERIELKKKIRPNDLCYCKEKKIKNCEEHKTNYHNFKKISLPVLKQDYAHLYKLLEEYERYRRRSKLNSGYAPIRNRKM
ncbi:MAG: hypothetical protein AAGG68_29205 [Bacteroidota bacterium]